jgi:protein O-GlcNAc transferase
MAVDSDLSAALKNHKAGRLEAAEQCYRRVLASDPNQADALHLLGLIVFQKGQQAEALKLIGRAIELKESRSDFHNNLGNVLTQYGRVDEAIAAFRRALELKPEDANVRSNMLIAIQYRANISLAELAAEHAEFERQHAAIMLSRRLPLPFDRDTERPLTLGFVSPNFRQHPIGHFVVRPLENLHRDQFKVVCYSDGAAQDDYTHRFQAASTIWRETIALTNVQLVERIRADRIDILFDLAGHTAGNRMLVFARKPAPIQITWADYVGTTGLAAIDFILADSYEIPPASEPHYTERVLRMPNGYVCYDPPSYAPRVTAPPAFQQGFITFGSFNYRPKITVEMIDVWARILNRVPNSRLVLKNGGLHDASVAGPLWHEFASRGIEQHRLECLGWSPHPEMLAEYQRIDVALDPYPYNGGLTTCEAMWMGVPVVTFPGETFASRHSLSHLSNVGFTETIARSLDHYEDLAVSLAADLPRLAALRSEFRAHVAASPLCDGKLFAHHFMRILRGIWRPRCQAA